jgi:two-component system NtrC family sensor kinase
MFSSIRTKLIAGFLSVSFLVGAVSLLVGGRLLYKAVLSEATNRIQLDLNTARGIYANRVREVALSLNTTTLGSGFRSALKERNVPDLVRRLTRLAREAGMDFAGIVTKKGTTLCRFGPHSIPSGKMQVPNPVANLVLQQKTPISGTVVLSKSFLLVENPRLADQARIRVLPTPRAAPGA